jgi:hypothetical protein
MRRLAVLLGIALIAFASPAVAVPATGTATLTGTEDWSGAPLSDLVTVTTIHGTFDGTLGKGTYEGTLSGGSAYFAPDCDFPSFCQPITGSITFSGRRGSFTGVVQPGSFVGVEDIHPRVQSRTYTLTLQVTDGTRSYSHADGLLTLSYFSLRTRFFDENFNLITTITDTGTLTGDLR